MTQAPTPGPLSGDDELIERGLRTIRTYDAFRSLRDALSATTSRLTGYDWNADPDSITKQQGDAFAAADKVFSDLDAAVAAHPDIDLPECEACNGTGKIEEAARTEGANQHSACIRSCDECDGCGFAPEPSLAPTAPVEASGSFEERAVILTKKHGNPVGTDYEQGQNDMDHRMVTMARDADAAIAALRPQPSGETRTPWRVWTADDHPPYDGKWFVAKCDFAVRVVHYEDQHDRLPIDHTGWAWPSVPTHWMRLSDLLALIPPADQAKGGGK